MKKRRNAIMYSNVDSIPNYNLSIGNLLMNKETKKPLGKLKHIYQDMFDINSYILCTDMNTFHSLNDIEIL